MVAAGKSGPRLRRLSGYGQRETVLAALMSGQALHRQRNAAYLARVLAPDPRASTVSQLTAAARLIASIKQGRFPLTIGLASPLVARCLKASLAVSTPSMPGAGISRARPTMRRCRLPRGLLRPARGRLGVAIADALVAGGHIVLGEDGW